MLAVRSTGQATSTPPSPPPPPPPSYAWFDPAAVYDLMGTIISTSNMLALLLCALLVVKVCVRAHARVCMCLHVWWRR